MNNNPIESKEIVKCKHCNSEFSAYKKEKRTFCSKECWKQSKVGISFIAKKGENVNCSSCNKEIYKTSYALKRSKNHFCSIDCSNEFQSINKVTFNCKTCNIEFKKSKSEVLKSNSRGHNVLYCSVDCRNNDSKRMSQKSYQANQSRLEKYGLNKFEQEGRYWLLSLGYILDKDFEEQMLLLEKISVDVYFPKQKVVIQFDGDYWHNKPDRIEKDNIQNEQLLKAGIKVLRISDTITKKNGFNSFDNSIRNILK